MAAGKSNELYWGDNLDILRTYFDEESVDLIYLDPPFNSKASYNVLYKEKDGRAAAAQHRAFEDTWHWDLASAAAFQEIVESGGAVSQAMQAFRKFLGDNDILAYLAMMAPRLVELHRVLKPTGSIYLHCDPTASHYLKLLLDAIFGPKQFRNEIAWHYTGWNKKMRSHFERRHDILLFYGRGKPTEQEFNSFALPWASEEEYLRVRKQKLHIDESGRKYVLSDAGGGKRVKRYLEEAMAYGRPVDDVWNIDKLNNSARESLGYPTQKPEALLERIILASSNEGDTILDPFCGCGTAVAVAERLKRRWIGIDITYLAIGVMRHRFERDFAQEVKYELVGQPVSIPDAEALFQHEPYQFQWWVLWRMGVNPIDKKKGADRGVDGRMYFHETTGETRQAILSVKGGGVNAAQVRDLRGVVEREGAALGVFVTLRQPTSAMKKEAASSGFWESTEGEFYPRIQILTVEELFAGKTVDYPATGPGLKRRPIEPEQLMFPEERAAVQSGAAPKPPRAVPDMVEELLQRAGIDRPPIRLEPILNELGMELSADPKLDMDAQLVPMGGPPGGMPTAWMVYYNPDKPEVRRRFTIAHEVGHVLLHGVPTAAAARGGGGRFKAREREVERFAAELLMPRRLVRAAVAAYGTNVDTLRGLFQVSRRAMEIRLDELGLGRD